MNPSFATPAAIMIAPDDQREHRRQRDRVLGAPVRAEDREDRGRDHRPQRGVGAEDEDPRGPEHGVADQAQDRRVQPRDRGQSREFGVGHPLRHQQRRQHESRRPRRGAATSCDSQRAVARRESIARSRHRADLRSGSRPADPLADLPDHEQQHGQREGGVHDRDEDEQDPGAPPLIASDTIAAATGMTCM